MRKPGLIDTNFAVFKNVTVAGNRAAQLRVEIYNLFNQIEFQDIDRTARFDATGAQINPNFGTAIGIANPTRPPRNNSVVSAVELLRSAYAARCRCQCRSARRRGP